jgi:hypothetical protein
MSAFLAGLGAALSTGSALSGKRRAERRQELIDKQDREQQLMQMALAREGMDLQRRSADLQERSFAGQELDRSRGFAKDLIAQIGPEGVVDDTAAAAIEAGGLGSRLGALQTQTAPDPISMQTIQLEGLPQQRTLNATAQERMALDATRAAEAEKTRVREMQERAREAIQLPGFEKMSPINQATVWKQAGFEGNIPEDWRAQAAVQHGYRMAEIGAQGANTLAAATARGPGQAPKKMPLGMINQFTELDDAIRMAEQMEKGYEPGDTGTMPWLGANAPNWVTEASSVLMPGMVEPGGFGNAAKQRQAAIALAKQIIGKGLEGGVLRKEDETKYAAILPTISDPPDVVTAKLSGLRQRLLERRDIYTSNAEVGGYEMPTGGRPNVTFNGAPVVAPGAAPKGGKPDPFGIR